MSNSKNLTNFTPIDKPTTPLAATMTGVRLPQHIHDKVASGFASGYEKSAWLREVIEAAAIARWKLAEPEPTPSLAVDLFSLNLEELLNIQEQLPALISKKKEELKDRRLEQGIVYLAERCDGAETEDGQGYNKGDSYFGKRLATRIGNGKKLLKYQAEKALRMLQKYTNQLQRGGLSLPQWEAVEHQYPESFKLEIEINGEVCVPEKRVQIKGQNIAVYSPYDATGAIQRKAKAIPNYRFFGTKEGGDNSWRYPLTLEAIQAVLVVFPEPEYIHEKDGIEGTIEILRIEEAEELAKQEFEALTKAEAISDLIDNLDAPLSNGWQLREYQKAGVEWLLSHGKNKIYRGGILADQMGLGKTLTALVGAKRLQEKTGCKIFVIAPVSLQQTWLRTAEIVQVAIECSSNSYQKIPTPLENTEYLLIVDEAHSFQEMKSKRTESFLNLAQHPNCCATWCLTGTPLKNGRPNNLYPLLAAIEHPLAASKLNYQKTYCNAHHKSIGKKTVWDVSGASHLDELSAKLSDAILQRTKAECLPELPTKTRLFKEARLQPKTEKAYNEAIAKFVAEYKERAKQGLVDPDAEALVTLNILRKTGSNAKVESAIELANELLEQGQQVVIFTEFVESAKAIYAQLGGELLTGESKPEDRQPMCDRFQSGESKVLIGTIKAGGVGLTLTAASNVILVDRPWTPGDTEQAEDRCIVEGQLIHTRRGFLPIEQVGVGDVVLTHKGNWKTVTDTSRREHRGLLTKLTYRRFDEPLSCTHDHKVFAVKKGQLKPDWIEAHKVLPGDFLAMPRPASLKKSITDLQFPQHLRHSAIQVNQFGMEQANGRYVQIPDLIKLDDDLLFIIGWYLAEGFASVVAGKGRFISFSGHEKERSTLEMISGYLSQFGVKSTIYTKKDSKGIELRAYSIELAYWFHEWFGSDCYTKKIPSLLMDLPAEQTKVLLSGYISGDGYCRGNSVEWVSASPTLASQMGLLALRCGKSVALRRGTHHVNHWIGSYTENGSPSNPALSFSDSEYVYHQVTKTETFFATRKPKTMVYDLTVEDDHSFVVGQAIVHNCHRLGQNNAVFATWMQLGIIDYTIDNLIQQKQDRIDLVMKGKRKTLRGITSPKDLAKELLAIL